MPRGGGLAFEPTTGVDRTTTRFTRYASVVCFSQSHSSGKERDAESGNDYFGARYYASTMGRWLSPDWSAKEDAVPYAKLDNPQTLNLYQYGLNNPLTVVGFNCQTGVVLFGGLAESTTPVWQLNF